MTEEELKNRQLITLREALREAFHAGSSHCVGSHRDFRQIHASCDRVVDALEARVVLSVDGEIP